MLRAAAFLTANGLGPGDHIGLIGENSPEWGMAWFAIARIGATAIPLERDLRKKEIRRLLGLGHARALLISDSLFERRKDVAVPDDANDDPGAARRGSPFIASPRSLRSATRRRRPAESSGCRRPPRRAGSFPFSTPRAPPARRRGVMLTHFNFTSLVAKLASVYDIDERDGALSILPLHHAFEFTTGFLLPLSRGAQIAYVEEISPEAIDRELRKGRTTCIVGVPALWDLLRRRILAPFAERSRRLEDLVSALIDATHLLRDDTGLNLGPAVFFPVHSALGGRIRYLISGAAALSDATWKTFRGLGFNLAQGYGLTEAAPVLTVTRPDERAPMGSVGRALRGSRSGSPIPTAPGWAK